MEDSVPEYLPSNQNVRGSEVGKLITRLCSNGISGTNSASLGVIGLPSNKPFTLRWDVLRQQFRYRNRAEGLTVDIYGQEITRSIDLAIGIPKDAIRYLRMGHDLNLLIHEVDQPTVALAGKEDF